MAINYPQLNFGTGSVIDPTKNLINAFQSVDSSLSNTLDRSLKQKALEDAKIQQELQNRRADAQLAIQQAAADRAQEAYDKKLKDQSVINQVLSSKGVGTTSLTDSNTQAINKGYEALLEKYKGQNIDKPGAVQDAYSKDLAFLNSKLFDEMVPDEQGVYSTDKHYGTQTEVRDAIVKDLMSKGIDYTTAVTLADTRAKTLVPTLDAKTIADNKKYNLDVTKAMYPNKSSSGTTINFGSDGFVTSSGGSGKNYTVSTYKEDPELLAKTIDRIKKDKSLMGEASGWWYGEKRPTPENLNKYITVFKHMGYSDTQIARGLQAGVTDNYTTDPTLIPMEQIVKIMGKPGADSSRVKTQGNANSDAILQAYIENANRNKAFQALLKQNQALDLQGSPNVDTGLFGIEHAFDGQTYKDPSKNTTTSSKPLFKGTDALSKAMTSKTPGEVAKLAVENPNQFTKLYEAMSKRQQEKIDKVLGNKNSQDYFTKIGNQQKPLEQYIKEVKIKQKEPLSQEELIKGLTNVYDKDSIANNPILSIIRLITGDNTPSGLLDESKVHIYAKLRKAGYNTLEDYKKLLDTLPKDSSAYKAVQSVYHDTSMINSEAYRKQNRDNELSNALSGVVRALEIAGGIKGIGKGLVDFAAFKGKEKIANIIEKNAKDIKYSDLQDIIDTAEKAAKKGMLKPKDMKYLNKLKKAAKKVKDTDLGVISKRVKKEDLGRSTKMIKKLKEDAKPKGDLSDYSSLHL